MSNAGVAQLAEQSSCKGKVGSSTLSTSTNCLSCGQQTFNPKFCSRSCSASYNNKGLVRNGKPAGLCKHCEARLNSSDSKYCSSKCQKDFEYAQRIDKWKKGEVKGYVGKTYSLAKWLRRYLQQTLGTACMKCGWDEKHPEDGSTLTEINHIDGDASNNREENLEILCPNCHSMTSNFRARNKNSCRVR